MAIYSSLTYYLNYITFIKTSLTTMSSFNKTLLWHFLDALNILFIYLILIVNMNFLDERQNNYLLGQDRSDISPCPNFPQDTVRFKCHLYMQNVGLPHSRETLKLWISKLTKDSLHTSFFPSEEGDLIFVR